VVFDAALVAHDGVNTHIVGWARKTASNEIIAAIATRATIVITRARKADGDPGLQHPIFKRNLLRYYLFFNHFLTGNKQWKKVYKQDESTPSTGEHICCPKIRCYITQFCEENDDHR
jgi:hypothetical protein